MMWFIIFLVGEILIIPLYFYSVEHIKLEERFGKERGQRIGDTLGIISGWGFFGFWIGLWISPQPRFNIPFLQDITFNSSYLDFQIPLLHFILFIIFIIPGIWLGIGGVKEMGLKVAETHRPAKLIVSGLYSRVRHPQYTGGLLSHVGVSFLLSGMYSLLITPFMILLNILYCWKEENELVREFGDEYREYRKIVPMLLPRFHQSSDD
jgi:protein-S-isoprenylcysteine O-methyltransferase Ste14